jgi:hypothetical protein
LNVADDCEPYPLPAGRATTQFVWSVLDSTQASPTWTYQTNTSDSFTVSQAQFPNARPGDTIKLRVEARDTAVQKAYQAGGGPACSQDVDICCGSSCVRHAQRLRPLDHMDGAIPAMTTSIHAGARGSKADAGPTYDAPPMPLDATSDGGLADAGAVLRDAPGPDTSQPPDVLADLRPADSLPPDTATHCVAQIESVVPATDSFMDFGLVAGPNLQVVLRASVVSGGPATAASWSWQANRDGTPISAVLGTQDPASAAFTLTVGGQLFVHGDRQDGGVLGHGPE